MKHLIPASIITVCYCLLLAGFFSSCGNHTTASKNDIPYPSPLPDTAALTFLPGIVSKDSFDFNAAFSPDGKSYYFSRSMNDKPEIYVTKHNGEKWSEPVLVSFSGSKHSDADPAFAPDGKLYFISTRPRDASDTTPDYDIWFSTPMAGETWSAPENLISVNTDSNEYYVSFSTNGNLYFASSRPGGLGQEDIYVSRWSNGQYTTPENLGPAINSPKSEFDPFISAKEDALVFASSNRDDSYGGADLYASKLENNKQWRQAVNMGNTINTNTRDFCPYYSPDGKYFFFSSARDVKWIPAK